MTFDMTPKVNESTLMTYECRIQTGKIYKGFLWEMIEIFVILIAVVSQVYITVKSHEIVHSKWI